MDNLTTSRIEDGHPLLEHVRLLDRLGPPKQTPILTDGWDPANREKQAEAGERIQELAEQGITATQLSQVRCACNKMVSVTEMTPFNTGIMNALDNVCQGCRSNVKGMSIFVCARCRAVVARLAPHTTPSGFKYEPNKTYHLDCCAVCAPEIVNTQPGSLILEELTFLRKKGKTLPKEWAERQRKKPLILQ